MREAEQRPNDDARKVLISDSKNGDETEIVLEKVESVASRRMSAPPPRKHQQKEGNTTTAGTSKAAVNEEDLNRGVGDCLPHECGGQQGEKCIG